MRLVIKCVLDRDTLYAEYRRGFASMLKEAMRRSNPELYNRYYVKNNKPKPFTFAVYFKHTPVVISDKLFRVGREVYLYFSTSCLETFVAVYNGLVSMKKHNIYGNEIRIEDMYLDEYSFHIDGDNSNRFLFKTISPVLIESKDKPQYYLLPHDEGFEEALNYIVRVKAKQFLGDATKASIKFMPVGIHKKCVYHYGLYRTCFAGKFYLEGDSQILEMIYLTGLGWNCGQGFGMLKHLKSK